MGRSALFGRLAAGALAFVAVASVKISSARGATAPAGSWQRRFVDVGGASPLWVEHKIAADQQPTLIFLNGLTYSTAQWRALIAEIEQRFPRWGLVTYDMRGQGASLLRSGLPLAPIQFKSQVRDLAALVRSLGRQPIHLVGLSYGASIGHAFMLEHADSVRSFFSVAAFLAPDPTQDAWIRFHVARVRGTPLHPMQPLSDEQLYDYFLRVLIYTTYPGAEPIILENPLKIEGVFRLVQGVRKFNVFDVMTDLPPQKIHYLWSAKDEYLDPALIGRFLRELPPDVPLSETIVREGEHKLPEQFPAFLAQWLGAVLTRAPLFKNGARWEAHPLDGVARSGARELYFEPETGYRRPGLNKSNLGWTEELSGWRFTHADPRKPLCKALF